MDRKAREELAEVLRNLRSGGSFSTRRTAPAGDLAIDIRGVGPLRLPVTATQANQLRLVARPAKYGHGEDTVFDRRVRDTWEVPRSRVKIDKRRWNQTLRPMLDLIRDDLGLAPTTTLTPELHSMLLYEPHQFFAAHQDSEKSDRMVATLVVMLPSNSAGGELVVDHGGESVRYPGSASSLVFVAFFADTRHEVLPVERGYRVVLTYDLVLTGDTARGNDTHTALVAPAARLMERHFEETPEPRWRGDKAALDPPDRLVFLLDHQYTQRGLRWAALKGDDAARAEVLRQAADLAQCEMALAHTEIQETWDAYDSGPPGWRRGGWDWDDDPGDGESAELGELIDSSVEIAPAAGERVRFAPHVTIAELAAVTASRDLEPHDTEHTGYMGNWGNTMDRWYRRAAVVIWPQARSFVVRAQGDLLGALHELLETPDAAQSRPDQVGSLLPFWARSVRAGDQQGLLPLTLRLAVELDNEELATSLLQPYAIEAVTPADGAAMTALAEQRGHRWFDRQVTAWMGLDSGRSHTTPERIAWVETLPEICADLHDHDVSKGTASRVARTLASHSWKWMQGAIARAATSIPAPSHRETALRDLAAPLLALLRSTVIAEDARLRGTILDVVCDPTLHLTPMLVDVVNGALGLPSDQLDELGVIRLARHFATTLREELAQPERADDDWSITQFDPGDCCDDCRHLAAFLADRTQQELTWPLAKPRRQHIHQRIDETELPVTHKTHRQGSPHKLILTKTPHLFTRDVQRRAKARAWLESVEHFSA